MKKMKITKKLFKIRSLQPKNNNFHQKIKLNNMLFKSISSFNKTIYLDKQIKRYNTQNYIDHDEEIDKQWQLGMKKFYEGKVSEGLGICNQALIKAQDLSLHRSLVAGYLNLAHMHFRMNELEQAIRFLKHASDSAEKVEPGYKKDMILPMTVRFLHEHANRILNTSKTFSSLQEALVYFEDSLDISKKSGNNLLIADSYEQIGSVLSLLGKNDQAIENLLLALKIFNENKMTPKEYLVCKNLTIVLGKLGRWNECIKYHEKRIEISNLFDNKSANISSQIDLADTYFNLENYGEASHICKMTLRVAKQINDEKAMMVLYNLLMKISGVLGAFEQEDVFRQKKQEIERKVGLNADKFDYTGEFLRVIEK